jgi:peptidoglycan/xylan/chitin deacetylase (PgdA/CDA1 family)
MIVATDPDIFKRACDDGHDCGVHAWDHVLTQDKLRPMSESDFESLYDKAAAMFEKISGRKPTCYAAPGWQVSEASLAAQERLNLKYASDTRGRCPFTPKYKSRAFSVPQIPTTLPTMDEMLGLEGVTDERVPDVWIGSLDKQWNVLTIHAEMEGLSKLGTFEIFLHKAKADGVRFMTLREVAERADISPGEIVEGELPGRAGSVALQNAV